MNEQPNQPAAKSNGLAITALILGIVAFLLGWTGPIGLVVAIAAVVFGVIGLVKKQSKGMSITGLVLGSIAAIFAVGITLFGVALFNEAEKSTNTSQNETTQNEPTEIAEPQSTSDWDLDGEYESIETGMTKSEVEGVLSRDESDCYTTEDETFGKTEYCTYGDLFTDPGTISVVYDNDDTVSSKSKFTN